MMKMHTFMGKVNIEGLHQLDSNINDWLKENKPHLVEIRQSFGTHQHHDGRREEPVLLITVWYETE